MSTQIFINNNGCKPEYTKIASHSFGFVPTLEGITDRVFIGGTISSGNIQEGSGTGWSTSIYDLAMGTISPGIGVGARTVGIPTPINLIPEDKVTISGTMLFGASPQWIANGYDVNAVLGVYYFDCSDATNNKTYTFIPLESFTFDIRGTLCFETSVTLNSNFDLHTTRLIVGFNVFAVCNPGPGPIFGICIAPETTDFVTVSYSLDIERPCYVNTSASNFIIKNCCEPLITELVNATGLVVGNFYVDKEGNCWEVISNSNDVTNFTREFSDTYTTCLECQDANPCPENLKIGSCCIQGQEYVSSSLPGLNVGDTFVDNNGLCWRVEDTTSFPISEESITVDTIIIGDCVDCTDANPCPDIWYIDSCCGKISEIIAAPQGLLSQSDSFVDTNGICWTVLSAVQQLPTNYNIVVDTVYSVDPQTNCDLCKVANPCPLEYFLTVRACCDDNRIEVISIPAKYMELSEGTIFKDRYQLCWEVMSYNTTGVETYPVDWAAGGIGTFPTCLECTAGPGGAKPECYTLWEVRDCQTDIVYTTYAINFVPVIGLYYGGAITNFPAAITSCFEVLGYGYPQAGINDGNIGPNAMDNGFTTCDDCLLALRGGKTVDIQSCCGGPIITVATGDGFQYGANNVYIMTLGPLGSPGCWTLLGFSMGTPTYPDAEVYDYNFTGDCTACLEIYNCS